MAPAEHGYDLWRLNKLIRDHPPSATALRVAETEKIVNGKATYFARDFIHFHSANLPVMAMQVHSLRCESE
jgi:hypothetical protein